jgi:hypothetical protein
VRTDDRCLVLRPIAGAAFYGENVEAGYVSTRRRECGPGLPSVAAPRGAISRGRPCRQCLRGVAAVAGTDRVGLDGSSRRGVHLRPASVESPRCNLPARAACDRVKCHESCPKGVERAVEGGGIGTSVVTVAPAEPVTDDRGLAGYESRASGIRRGKEVGSWAPRREPLREVDVLVSDPG